MTSKVWEVMNDLEMVTSKICSAREIIDAAIDRIQEQQYDKAEMMMSAAHEYLEYYLQEFDEKFKLAWQETVVKQKEEDPCMTPWGHSDLEYVSKNTPLSCDKDDPSPECRGAWDSFWDSYQGSTVSSVQYTEEELNSMCDSAEKQEKQKPMTYDEAVAAGWEMTADGFWFREHKKDKVKKWVLPVEEVKDTDIDETEYFVSFPDDLLEAADLKEGDQIQWVDNGDGSYTLTKVTKQSDD